MLPAGAGDWWWGAAATRQDRTVNPETLPTEAKGDTGESEDVYGAWFWSGMFWNGNCGFDVAAGRLLCRFPVSGYADTLSDNGAPLLRYLLMHADMLATSNAACNCYFTFKGLQSQHKHLWIFFYRVWLFCFDKRRAANGRVVITFWWKRWSECLQSVSLFHPESLGVNSDSIKKHGLSGTSTSFLREQWNETRSWDGFIEARLYKVAD